MKRVILFTRNSPFQIYCANKLFHLGIVSTVFIEDGGAFLKEKTIVDKFKILFKNFQLIVISIIKKPSLISHYCLLFFRTSRYFGNQEYHNQRVLKNDFKVFNPRIDIRFFQDINSDESFSQFEDISPDILLVFGTQIVKSRFFKSKDILAFNLHWGWSPNFRGEGIVSALAVSGKEALGVTIHMLSIKADGGGIIYQYRPEIDDEDNFYSIGLKLSLLGINGFITVIKQLQQNKEIKIKEQDLNLGNLYKGSFMKINPQYYHLAWRNLKNL
jgi:hypothetical protein